MVRTAAANQQIAGGIPGALFRGVLDHLGQPSYSFTVPGKPVGKCRTTQRQKWVSARWKGYVAFKDDVLFFSPFVIPIKPRGKSVLSVVSYFIHNGSRPDPENVLGAVADAIYKNDRDVAGFFDFGFDREAPRVEVSIWILK